MIMGIYNETLRQAAIMEEALDEIAAGNVDGESIPEFARRAVRVAKASLNDRLKFLSADPANPFSATLPELSVPKSEDQAVELRQTVVGEEDEAGGPACPECGAMASPGSMPSSKPSNL